MSGKYGRTEMYVERFPVREQAGGTCTDCSMLYAMEMVGLLTDQPVVQLSQLYLDWRQGGKGAGGTAYGAAMAAIPGVCVEHLWPATLTYGPDTWDTNISSYEQLRSIQNTAPDAVCLSDAANHKLLDWAWTGSSKAEITAAIDAGYALLTFVMPNHMECLWDYDDGGALGLDSRSSSATPAHMNWDEALSTGRKLVVKRANFSGVATPRRINPSMPNNNVPVLRAAQRQLTTWRPDMVTAVDIAELHAKIDSLVPDTGTAPPIVPPSPVVPPVAGLQTVTDDKGVVWTISASPKGEVKRDGVGAAGFWASQLVWTGTRIEAQQKDSGGWSYWNGSGWSRK
jgi:hypothetical protein